MSERGSPAARVARDAGGRGLRRILLGLVLLGCTGLLAELFLLEHTESVTQWLPFVVLALGALAGVALWLRPGRATVRAFRVTMIAFLATGIAGLYLHYVGNRAFELEMDASLRGVLLAWRSLRGATPALAPGSLVQLGLLGLALTYRHPADAPEEPDATERGNR